MPKVLAEDFSIDMRTILAKERTILANQRLQTSIIGIGLGLFATGFTLLRLLPDESFSFRVVAAFFIFGGTVLCTISVLNYFYLKRQLTRAEYIEEHLARTFRVEHFDDPIYQGSTSKTPAKKRHWLARFLN